MYIHTHSVLVEGLLGIYTWSFDHGSSDPRVPRTSIALKYAMSPESQSESLQDLIGRLHSTDLSNYTGKLGYAGSNGIPTPTE